MNTVDSGFADNPKVLLWGDSLTEGKPGVAFTSFLSESLPELRLVNRGRGGDTALSLLRRLKDETVPDLHEQFEIAILWVGVNDIFADLVPGYGLWKTAMRKPPTRDPDSFAGIYRSILAILRRHALNIILLPPLFVGEDPTREMNRRLVQLGDIISTMAEKTPDCRFVDLRLFLPLERKKPSSFLPVNPWSKLATAFGRVENEDYDRAAERRGLRWTYDGVHFNTAGARKVSRILAKEIEIIMIRDEL